MLYGTDLMYINKLIQYGYLKRQESPYTELEIAKAIESFRFNMNAESTLPYSIDELFSIPRCGLPDGPLSEGSGSWRSGCHPDWPNNHSVVYRVDKSGMPSYLTATFEDSWELMAQAYANVGLVVIRDDRSSSYNSLVTFQRGSGWIGLAIVGRNQTCSTKMWAKFDNRYGSSFSRERLISQWAFLLAHELGHNCGMSHTRGGIMNPSLINGTFTEDQWKNDIAYPTLKRYYGGEPVAPIWSIPQPQPGPNE